MRTNPNFELTQNSNRPKSFRVFEKMRFFFSFDLEDVICGNFYSHICNQQDKVISKTTHVGKYDRADDRPKLAMMAANVGYRYWTDD